VKRILAGIVVVALAVVALALPASADPPNNSALIGGGGCIASININNDFDATGPRQAIGGVFNIGSDGSCAYVGIKARVLKCDGSTSTSAELGTFWPDVAQGAAAIYNFSCQSAGIIGVYVRTDSASGVWNPSSGGYIYYAVGPPESCTPAYCIL
jgi:hypothetical protein